MKRTIPPRSRRDTSERRGIGALNSPLPLVAAQQRSHSARAPPSPEGRTKPCRSLRTRRKRCVR